LEGRLDRGAYRSDVRTDRHQVLDLVGERVERRPREYRLRRREHDGDERHRFDDLPGIARDGDREINVESVRPDPVRMQPDVVRAPPEFFDPDRPHVGFLEFPAEQPDLASGEHPFGGVHVFEGRFHRQERRDLEVRKEAQERLGPCDLVEPLHAKILQGGERIDHDPGIPPTRHFAPQHLFERGDGDLDPGELGGASDNERYLAERHRGPDRGNILERNALVAHHIRDRVEHLDLFELRSHPAVIESGLVRRFLDGHEQASLAAPDPLAKELEREGGLTGTRRPDNQIRPARNHSTLEHGVEADIPGRDAGLGLWRQRAFCGRGESPHGVPRAGEAFRVSRMGLSASSSFGPRRRASPAAGGARDIFVREPAGL
jgi:hypothetical protein